MLTGPASAQACAPRSPGEAVAKNGHSRHSSPCSTQASQPFSASGTTGAAARATVPASSRNSSDSRRANIGRLPGEVHRL
ncbi:MAG: hypothetical protein IPK27_00805 [Rhodanobacteraceae bacterium]|nr:hypothetical protein [Rhodanobacteraceae bacterium]